MFQVAPHTRIYLACQPVDFRKGIDALSALCRSQLGKDPFCGAVFLFRNRQRTSLRLLAYDGQGFWLCTKRLSHGKLAWWPKSPTQVLTELAARQLNILLWNGNPETATFSPDWKALPRAS